MLFGTRKRRHIYHAPNYVNMVYLTHVLNFELSFEFWIFNPCFVPEKAKEKKSKEKENF